MHIFKLNNSKHLVKSWIPQDKIEESAIAQIANVTNLPFLFNHLAIMPDVHAGFGVTIGSVLATKDVVLPSAVGVDIGCGMAAVKTSLTGISIERLKEIMTLIRKKIPVGFNHHSKPQDENLMPYLDPNNLWPSSYPICSKERESALTQLGTLGSGNHFIELQKGSDGYIWFMIHSGSRNLGFKVAKYYNDIAVKLNEKWHTSVPKNHELAFLPIDTKEAIDYLREMKYCLDFAQANRDLMVQRIKEAFTQIVCLDCNGAGGIKDQKCINCNGRGYFDHFAEVSFDPTINIHHNYVAIENHFGHNVWVHRKGATSAKEGEIGIIPGSQGTASYVVKGKGNVNSFMSCSHGAGRTMSRTKAIKELNLAEEQRKLDEQGILHTVRNQKSLDESPSAYKDILEVMKNQEELVDIIVELKPLAVIKG